MPAAVGAPSFVISGRAEAREGDVSYRERIVRFGETGGEAMHEKARYVMDEVAARLALLGAGWHDATATQVYTIRDIHPFMVDEIVRRGAARTGLTWHYARPPVRDLEFEVDCRSVRVEEVI